MYEYGSTVRTTYTNNNYEPGILSKYDNEQYFAKNKLQGMTKEKLLHEMQEEFDFTIESIKKYGGFYIGRYETGNLSSKIPAVQRMNTDLKNQTWYTEYSKANNIYDMVDNVCDWTLEGNGSNYHEERGSNYGTSGLGIPASYRSISEPGAAAVLLGLGCTFI